VTINYWCPTRFGGNCPWCAKILAHGRAAELYGYRPVETHYDLTGATFSALLRTNKPTSQREDLYGGLSDSAAESLRAAYFELTSEETARRLGWEGSCDE
jgi:hypothetical protein